jgi:hypothetical protein
METKKAKAKQRSQRIKSKKESNQVGCPSNVIPSRVAEQVENGAGASLNWSASGC